MELWGSRRDLGYSYQYKSRRDWILRNAEQLVPVGGSVLDIAGGSGNFALPLAEKGFRVIWNDLRPGLIERVKQKYEYGDIAFVPGNIFELMTNWKESFDGVVAAEVIEHMAHPDEFLSGIASMLKPGGRLFLSTPNGKYFRFHYPRFSDCPDPSIFESVQFKPDSDGHIFLLHADECSTLAQRAGLEVERIETMTNSLTRGHVKLGHLLPYLPAALVWAVESGVRKLPRSLRERLHCQMVAILRRPA